jgi:hypothetical protein
MAASASGFVRDRDGVVAYAYLGRAACRRQAQPPEVRLAELPRIAKK